MQLLTICKYFKFGGGPNQFQLQLLDKSPASSLSLIYIYFQLDISSFSSFMRRRLSSIKPATASGVYISAVCGFSLRPHLVVTQKRPGWAEMYSPIVSSLLPSLYTSSVSMNVMQCFSAVSRIFSASSWLKESPQPSPAARCQVRFR